MEGSFQRKIEYPRCKHDRACCVVDMRYGLGMMVENKAVSVRTVRMSDNEALKFNLERLSALPPSFIWALDEFNSHFPTTIISAPLCAGNQNSKAAASSHSV